jgi:hypothetical protein
MVSKFRAVVPNAQLEVEVAAVAPSTAIALVASGASAAFASLLIISKLAVLRKGRNNVAIG